MKEPTEKEKKKLEEAQKRIDEIRENVKKVIASMPVFSKEDADLVIRHMSESPEYVFIIGKLVAIEQRQNDMMKLLAAKFGLIPQGGKIIKPNMQVQVKKPNPFKEN